VKIFAKIIVAKGCREVQRSFDEQWIFTATVQATFYEGGLVGDLRGDVPSDIRGDVIFNIETVIWPNRTIFASWAVVQHSAHDLK